MFSTEYSLSGGQKALKFIFSSFSHGMELQALIAMKSLSYFVQAIQIKKKINKQRSKIPRYKYSTIFFPV